MVYVGRNEYPYGRMKMSHMMADTIEELHNMANAIGVDRKHFQNKKDKPHYDVCKQKKQIAIRYGAIEVSDKVMLYNLQKLNK